MPSNYHWVVATALWVRAALALLLLLAGQPPPSAVADAPSPEAIEFFETKIRPVLAEKCFECHSAEAKVLQGGLRLDAAAAVLKGGDSGSAIVPNKPDESLLLSALRYESFEMPPSGQLPPEVIEDFAKWVAMGAPDPRSEEAAGDHQIDANSASSHWAFERPKRAEPPGVQNAAWARTDADRFILVALEAAGLAPSPQATPRDLLRRLHYDLTGLPPTAEEVVEFEADSSDERYEATVDQLLAAPQFGERWGRYWLDVARYADTKGYLFLEDRNYKHAYKYRDWVIASFNADLPFDRFVVAQLAADQLEDPTAAPAMGFLTLGRRFLNDQHDIINDRIDVVTRGIMGLTVACARCHDHKYDPISTADYYSLYGVFASSQETPREDAPPALADAEKPVEPVVFLRGNPASRGPQVERHFLTCLVEGGEPAKFQNGSGRREMAEAVASRENPLTARVWVNRVWGHLFGRGLVTTASDFGTRGEPPSHPELLDYLACELMDDGWSSKRLIRSLVLSNTYRQASGMAGVGSLLRLERLATGDVDQSQKTPDPVSVDPVSVDPVSVDPLSVDPENRLLWRMNRRRLDLEALRDSLLAAAGRLDRALGGASIEITTAPFSTRRSVYGFIERQNLPAFFRTFDFANPNTHTPERSQTVSPQQALFLMNSPFVIEQALHLSERSRGTTAGLVASATSDAPDDAVAQRRSRVVRLFQFTLGRAPADDELAEALAFIGEASPTTSIIAETKPLWQFGWGTVDDSSGAVAFNPLAHFTGSAWQGGPTLPDPATGWAMLTASGGHPGDAAHATVRRWIAPTTGKLHIEGVLSHGSDQGDGVRGRIVASRAGIAGAWDAFHGEVTTAPPAIDIQAGDTIDFISDCRASVDYDSFNWTVTLRVEGDATDGTPKVWDSVSGFQGIATPPLGRWEELAQVLLMSNEFAFVD